VNSPSHDPAEPAPEPEDAARGRGARPKSPRERWGWAATILGLAVILGGVLHLTSATVGGRVHDFKERRTYTEVKTAAHRAFPLTLLLGLAGLGLVLIGGKLRAAARGERGEA